MKLAFVAPVLLVSAGGLAEAVASGQPPEFRITTKRKDDDRGRVWMDIRILTGDGKPAKAITSRWRCPRGASRATRRQSRSTGSTFTVDLPLASVAKPSSTPRAG